MTYIDGFVAAVPQANKAAYRDHAREALPLFKDHGAARMVENWGDDVPAGKVTDFHRSVRKKDDEAVVFSWIEWPSQKYIGHLWPRPAALRVVSLVPGPGRAAPRHEIGRHARKAQPRTGAASIQSARPGD